VFTNDHVCFATGILNESNYRIRTKIRRVSLSSVDSTSSADKSPERVNNIAIIGGGLAGLSAAYHLLGLSRHPLQITIYDKSKVGDGGASSVAGG
jgi:ribulose 1,5-bisphosphate synthetase/thiazole synthase